ncbi:maleylpyruvate isomerase family mycothiol-dependent enzyme [Myceligenerans crystallogenes]
MTTTRADGLVAAERRALAADLRGLTGEQWDRPSLCGGWTVADVVAHLGSAMTIGTSGWIRSIVGAGFRPGVHNQRQIERFRRATPGETLDRFARLGAAGGEPVRMPTKDPVPWLGELIVHGEDIRRPLGIERSYPGEALGAVARFYASHDYAVNSRSQVKGLHLVSADVPFEANAGSDALVEGPILALIMTMAGRPSHLGDLTGGGVPELRRRLRA